MHYQDWNGGWGAGGLLFMGLMMLVFWGGLAWVIVTLLRRPISSRDADRPPPQQAAPTATALLDERLARGDIDVEDYRARREALETGASGP